MTLPRVNLLLLLLVLALSGLVWWDLERSVPRPLPVLSTWEPGSVVSIRVQYPGHASLHLERLHRERSHLERSHLERKGGAPSAWLMVSPQQGEVRGEQVDRLLEILAAPYRAVFDLRDLSQEQQRQMGLVERASRPLLTFIGEDGVASLQIYFGDLESQTHHRYLLLDDKVYLVFDRFSYLLGMSVDQWLPVSAPAQ